MIEYISEMSKYDQIFYTLEYMIESGDILIDDAFIINEKAFEKFASAKEEIKDLGYDLKDCAGNIRNYLNGKSRPAQDQQEDVKLMLGSCNIKTRLR